jgi:hypothetical protein
MTAFAMLLGTANPIPILPPAGAQDRRVDADELAIEGDERSARVAGVDGCVGLDVVLVAFLAEAAAAKRTDDARGHGLAEAEWIADGDDVISDLQPIGIADLDGGQVLASHAQHGDVGGRIAADQPRRQATPILKRDDYLAGIFDHVVVCENVTGGAVDDHTRAGAHRLRCIGHLEVPPEAGISQKGVRRRR